MAHWFLTVVTWMLVALCVWYVTARQADDKMKALAARADSARVAFDTAKTRAIQAQFATKEAARREQRMGAALTDRLQDMQDSLASAHGVLADSSATADTLRATLSATVRQVDSLLFQVSAYMGAVDSLKQAHARERLAMTIALDRADTTIAIQDAYIRVLQSKECRVMGRPCPTRTQVFVAGTVLGIVLGLAR